jgi:hypothetical protein
LHIPLGIGQAEAVREIVKESVQIGLCAARKCDAVRSLPAGYSLGDVVSKAREDFFGWNCAAGVSIKFVVSLHNLSPQPTLDGCVSFLKCAQARANDLARRGVGSRLDEAVNVVALLAG